MVIELEGDGLDWKTIHLVTKCQWLIVCSDRSSYSDIVLLLQATFPDFHSVPWCNWCYKIHSKSLKQYQCNWCHKMKIDADWMSNVPMFKCSNVQMFQWSNVPMSFSFHRVARLSCLLVQWSIGPFHHWSISSLDHWSNGPLVHWTISLLVHWSIGLLVHWSIGP